MTNALPFTLEFSSESGFQFDGHSSLSVGDVAFAVRTYTEEPASPVVWFNASASSFSIERYEVRWVEIDDTLYGLKGDRPEPTTRTVFNATLSYLLNGPGAAFAAHASRAQLAGNDSLTITNAKSNTFLVHSLDDYTNRVPAHDDERTTWGLRGQYLVSNPDHFRGAASGAFRAYWTRSSATLQHEDGHREVLESRVWEEAPAGTTGVHVRHAVWHEIVGETSLLDFSISRNLLDQRVALLGHAMQFENARSISLARGTEVRGTLPDSAEAIGSSMWIRGTMSGDLAAQRGASQTAVLTAVVRGSAESFSYGGRPATQWPSTAAASSVFLAVILVVAYWMRDSVAHAIARIDVFMFAKLRKDDLLTHPTREFVWRILKEKPAATFTELRSHYGATLGKSVGIYPLYHHLTKLEKFGIVHSRREGRSRHYFVTGAVHNGDAERVSLLRTEPVGEIARLVHERPGRSQVDIRACLAARRTISRSTLQYHLERLVRAELVQVQRKGRRLTYEATQNMLRLAGPMRAAIEVHTGLEPAAEIHRSAAPAL